MAGVEANGGRAISTPTKVAAQEIFSMAPMDRRALPGDRAKPDRMAGQAHLAAV